MTQNGISVVIPSWNGAALLDQCLPTVRASLDQWGGSSEVIIADDNSTDSTPQHIAEKYPWATVITMPRRRGFVHTANAGVRAAKHTYICMLNNDMQIEPGFFQPLYERLESDPRIFAVSAKAVQTGTGALNLGRRVRRIENNTIIGIGDELDDPDAGHTLFATGGASLFRRSEMITLGCFDEMYAPFYTEDTDLGYRAWKRGWLILYEPRSLAHHIGGASISKKGAPLHIRIPNKLRTSTIIQRNAILFYVKNFTTPPFWAAYKKKIAWWTLTSILTLRLPYILGLLISIPRLPAAYRSRKIEINQSTLNDYQVYELLNTKYRPPEDIKC